MIDSTEYLPYYLAITNRSFIYNFAANLKLPRFWFAPKTILDTQNEPRQVHTLQLIAEITGDFFFKTHDQFVVVFPPERIFFFFLFSLSFAKSACTPNMGFLQLEDNL
jgi:hypothetical protein